MKKCCQTLLLTHLKIYIYNLGMANKSSNGCCGCIIGAIVVIVIIVLALCFVASRFVTIEQIGFADKTGILHRFNETYPEEATLRTEGMEGWRVYDFIMWVIKSGNYQPA